MGTTVAVGILLALSLAVAMVLYWRYREEESHYLQVGFTVYYIVYRVQQRLWSSTGDTERRSPTTYRKGSLCTLCTEFSRGYGPLLEIQTGGVPLQYLQVGFNMCIVYRVQQRLWSSTRDIERRTPTTFK